MNRYFDNASTSFPKPVEVAAQIAGYLNTLGGPAGRGTYPRAVEVTALVEECRDTLASFLGIGQPEKLFFTPGATHAINMVLNSLLKPGDHVVVSALEHNAVMRPLAHLVQTRAVTWSILPHEPDGTVIPERMHEVMTHATVLAIVSHMSNINGVIQPVGRIKNELGSTPLLVDAAQSAGATGIATDAWNIDFLAITGHKSLLGPPGIGALYCAAPDRLRPAVLGGTGSRSESFLMPETLPDRFEAGSYNIVGIVGLLAALRHRPDPGHTHVQFNKLLKQCAQMRHLRLLCARDPAAQGPLFSVQHRQMDCAALGRLLVERFGLETRVGLHCAPLAHQTLQTFPQGTVRLSLSPWHTGNDLRRLAAILENPGSASQHDTEVDIP